MLWLRQDQPALRIGWLLLLAFIPLLSYSGRRLQYFLNQYLSESYLGFTLGVLLLALVLVAGRWLYQVNKADFWITLLWFIPLFLILPMMLPLGIERMHFIVFGVFGFISLRLWHKAPGLVICFSVALLDEVFQWWLPDRVGDLSDVLINLVAVYGGALFAISGTIKR